ncbi:MAG: helix-turn-helix domain-containing protein [Bacteroidia bacterium]|nr:helix-turn-helix domain-containing protein [Bacteroidia bacterium]
MSYSLASILAILVSFQLAFLATFLLTNKKGNQLSNALLGILFALIALNLTDLALQLFDPALAPLFLAKLNDAFLFVFGPLIYLYTKSIIYSNFRLTLRDLIHLIPAILVLIIFFLPQESAPATQVQGALPLSVQIYNLILYLHLFAYYLSSLSLLKTYRREIRENYSNLSERNLSWLAFAINNFGIMILFSLIMTLSPITGSPLVISLGLFGILLFIFYFINRVIFKALRQPELFSGIPQAPSRKYASSKLVHDEAEEISTQLIKLMSEERLFLNPDLTLDQLAKRLGYPVKTLSQVINQSIEKSFYDFVNEYRIEEAQKLLKNPPDPRMTIQEVMYDVGFSSKSSFNTVFKKLTGKTPSEFRKS